MLVSRDFIKLYFTLLYFTLRDLDFHFQGQTFSYYVFVRKILANAADISNRFASIARPRRRVALVFLLHNKIITISVSHDYLNYKIVKHSTHFDS